ncbi:MAG: hypothetical protein JW761_04680 [Prolixibacteraceae bacterium]|nr:hypothetical protein [Prolixibacteraceae bacterium]
MRKLIPIITFAVLLIFPGCHSKNKSAEIAGYEYTETLNEFNTAWQSKIGNWLEEGVECYGLVVAINAKKVPQRGKPVKAKVLRISENHIKMKALEDVNIAPIENCSNLGISKGETWNEDEAELFQTKEEAIAYLKKKGLFMKN